MANDSLAIRQGSEVSEPSPEQVTYSPRVDIFENREEYFLLCDLPGAKVEDLHLRYNQGELSLEGKVAKRQQTSSYWRYEYGVGDFYRTFTLPSEVDDNKINADYKLGVLTVHVPKKESSKPKQIAIAAS